MIRTQYRPHHTDHRSNATDNIIATDGDARSDHIPDGQSIFDKESTR